MKRKPPVVSIILFIIIFIVFYFLEQRLHILTNTVHTSQDLDVNKNFIGKAEIDCAVFLLKTLF